MSLKNKIKRPRTVITLERYNDLAQNIIDDLENEISRIKNVENTQKYKGVKFLKGIKRNVVELQRKAKQLTKLKKKKNPQRKSGFDKKSKISEELAKFLKVNPDTELSRIEATRALCVYIHADDKVLSNEQFKRWAYLNKNGKRNLQDSVNRRVVHPDEKLSKLLRYDQYKKDVKNGKVSRKIKKTGKIVKVNDDNLYYYVINKLIQHHFVKF